MTDELLRKAAAVTPPRPGITFARAVTTTPASLDLSAYTGRFVTLTAQGGGVFYLFGTQAQAEAVDNSATSGNTQAQYLADGATASYLVCAEDDFLGYETSTGTATLRVHVSSGRTGQD